MTNRDREVTSITGEVTTRDGVKRQFSLSADYSWHQWGATHEELGNTVGLMDALQQAAAEFLVSDYETEDDDEQ